eukprot:jgi/Psemu1/33390/gm1.33390_g
MTKPSSFGTRITEDEVRTCGRSGLDEASEGDCIWNWFLLLWLSAIGFMLILGIFLMVAIGFVILIQSVRCRGGSQGVALDAAAILAAVGGTVLAGDRMDNVNARIIRLMKDYGWFEWD